MAKSVDRRSRRTFPVTVRYLPVVRCQVCDRTMPHRPGEVGAVLTAHYERAHPHHVATVDQATEVRESAESGL